MPALIFQQNSLSREQEATAVAQIGGTARANFTIGGCQGIDQRYCSTKKQRRLVPHTEPECIERIAITFDPKLEREVSLPEMMALIASGQW